MATQATKTVIRHKPRKVEYNWFEKTRPLLFITVSCVAFYGGTWQIKRRKQKIEYLNLINCRLNSSPVDCPTNLTPKTLEENRLLKVKVIGYPDFKNEVVVGPRVAPPSSNIANGGWGGFIYTPVKLKNNGKIILINRGWIPEEEFGNCPEINDYNEKIDNIDNIDNISMRKDNQIENNENKNKNGKLMKFIGMLSPLQAVPDFFDPVDVKKPFWSFITREAINERWNDMGIYIPNNEVPVTVNIMEPKTTFSQYPQRITEKDMTSVNVSPEQHGSYIIFWYSMSLLSMWYAYTFWKNPRATRLFRRSGLKPILKRSDVLNQREKHLRL